MARSIEFWVYDVECYKNYFYALFKNYVTKEKKWFRIYDECSKYDRNDVVALKEFVLDTNKFLIGFNSYEYDNQLLNYICKTKTIHTFPVSRLTSTLKIISDNIINNDYTAHKYDRFFAKVDLKRVANLEKSLKSCMINLKMNKVQTLPIPEWKEIQPHEVPQLEIYCDNDVESTDAMAELLKMELKARWNVEKQYGVPAMNESNSSISNNLFEKMYSDAAKIPIRDFKTLRSPVDKICLKDIIFGNIHFKDKILQEYLEYLKEQVVNCSVEKITCDLKPLEYKKTIYQLGAGGLHSVDSGGIYYSDDIYELIDCDVVSYYPTIMIIYMLYPEHLGKVFIEVLKFIKDRRVEFKKAGDDISSYIFKIIINSIFGKLGDKHSCLYSPRRMLETTINGQLFQLMQIEKMEAIGIEAFSANTDGVTYKVKRDKLPEFYRIMKAWEEYTKFDLEYTKYKSYVRLNVNNYIASYYKKDKLIIKHKGKILSPKLYEDLAKSYYMPVVAEAIESYFVNGTKVSDFIRNHKDILSFAIGANVGKKFDVLFAKDEDSQLTQNVVRYYYSTKGGRLLKRFYGNTTSVVADGNVNLLLDFDKSVDISYYDVDYNYYIAKAASWIKQIELEHKLHESKYRDRYHQGSLF